MRKTFLLVALALAVSTVVVVTAGASGTATPGVTAKTILLEGTFPINRLASSIFSRPSSRRWPR